MHHASTLARALWARLFGRFRQGIWCVAERQDWVIRREWKATVRVLQRTNPALLCGVVDTTEHLYHQTIHFGSIWMFTRDIDDVHGSNRIALTFFHGHEAMGEQMTQAIRALQDSLPRMGAVITACSGMAQRLRDWGVPEDKLHVIPISVDRCLFRPPTEAERQQRRETLGIPSDALCIGSFQKDGVGWDEGREPKHIKGPDTLVEVLQRLHRDHRIHVLLTGPARGYVRERLDALGIAYHHEFVDRYEDLPSYYHALDLYLVTSREEGGPKAVPECMASRIPLVCTRTGMAPDLIVDGESGFLLNVEDTDGLAARASQLLADPDLRTRFTAKATERLPEVDVETTALRYLREVYLPLRTA